MNLTELSEIDLKTIRDSLLVEKSSILNKTSEFVEQTLSANQVADEAEAASLDISTNISIHLHERDRNSLLMIERALSKIQEGTYGLCESCGQGISARRLQARPFTTLCIECMEEQEEGRNSLQ